MNITTVFASFLSSIIILGCASNDRILRIRSLGTVTNPQSSSENDGTFLGIHELTKLSDNTNILLVHGIGWIQERSDLQFGDNFIAALQRSYGNGKRVTRSEPCETSTLVNADSDSRTPSGGLKIWSSQQTKSYETDDPSFRPSPRVIGCLDKTTISVADGKTMTVYRFLWDDAMWNAFEWEHLGYDDPIEIRGGKKIDSTGYDDIDALRAKYNSQLKNGIVTYGLADAAMYIGPIGKIMREGVQAAICATLSDSLSGQLVNMDKATTTELCATRPTRKSSFAVITHSLGSRIVFDVLRTDLTPLLAERILDSMINSDIEVYMLANQIPLVGVGRIGDTRSTTRLSTKSLKFIAFSEINDLLTYELVPYFEHMYYTRCYYRENYSSMIGDARCSSVPDDDFEHRNRSFYKDATERKRLVETLGFDVVDIRAQFAPTLFPIYSGFIDPSIAHSGYFTSQSVTNLILCGAKKGKYNEQCVQ
jgi:hypothetical protein